MDLKFNNLLEFYRKRANMTLRVFCQESGANSSYWSALERGHAPPPSEQYFYLNLKKILNLSEEELTQLLVLKESYNWVEEDDLF